MFPHFAKINVEFDTSICDEGKELHAMYKCTSITSDMPEFALNAPSSRTARHTRGLASLLGLSLHETRLQSWTASPTLIILRVHSSTPERSQLHTTIHVLDFILWQVDFAATYFGQRVIASGLLLKPLCEATTRKGRLLPVAERRLQVVAAQLRSLSPGVGIRRTCAIF